MKSTETLAPDPHARLSLAATAAPRLALAVWACGLAALGAALLMRPELTVSLIVIAGIGLPLLGLMRARAESGLVALIFLASNFISSALVDVRLLGGGLDLRDLLLLGMFGALVIHKLLTDKLTIPWWPVGGLLLVFIGFAAFSALYALLYQRVELGWLFSELRPTIYYLIFFLTAWTILRPRQLVTLLVGLFLLADLTSTIILAQQFLGRENMLLAAMSNSSWYIRAADTSATFGTVRIVPPGHVLAYIMSICAFCLMLSSQLSGRVRGLLVFQFVYLNAGLLFTYTRAQWIASVIALVLVTMVLSWADKLRIAKFLIISACSISLVMGLGGAGFQERIRNAPFVDALTERALSIFTPTETLGTASLEWRVVETTEAIRSITAHPLIGVGLGNVYREPFLLQGESQGSLRRIRYVHNSYFYVAVKMGLPALLAFGTFALALLGDGWRISTRLHDDRLRRVTIGLLAGFAGFLVWAASQMHLFQTESTIVIGLLAGLIASMPALDRKLRKGGAL